MRIAFLGQGIMGSPMTLNLLKAGHTVLVWNRTPEKCTTAAAAGAVQAATPRDAAASAQAVLLMLTGPEACDAALFGPEGASQSLKPGMIVANMSTVSPSYSQRLAARVTETGAAFVDAPVAGSRKPAEDAALLVLAGGDPETLAELEPAFSAMSRRTIPCGPVGAGSTMKMANNLLLSVMMTGFAEALGLGVKGGLTMETMLDVLHSGPLSCTLFDLKEEMFRTGEFQPQFPAKHMAKDLRFILQTARESFANTPCAATALNLYETLLNQGQGELDFAAVAKVLG